MLSHSFRFIIVVVISVNGNYYCFVIFLHYLYTMFMGSLHVSEGLMTFNSGHSRMGFDGAATFSGKKSGVQGRLKKHVPHAVFVHCHCHMMQLACITDC